MTIPFGFSISDFIAITQLIQNIWQCANASASLKMEIGTLMTQFAELSTLTQRVMTVSLQEEAAIQPATQRCLELHLRRCRKHLQLFEKDTLAIMETCTAQSVLGTAKQIGQRLNFMLKRKAVLGKLISDFRHDTEAIRICVQAVVVEQQQRSQASLRDLLAANKVSNQNLNSLVAMLGSMPKDLGYTWEGGEFKRHIALIHATGEQILVPLDMWASFETLHGFLLLRKDYPGHRRMKRCHYRLIDCYNGSSFDAGQAHSWTDLARPGGKVLLSIIVGTWQQWKATGSYCPKCEGKEVINATRSGWRRCQKCDLEFDTLNIESWPHETEPIDERFGHDGADSGSHPEVHPNTQVENNKFVETQALEDQEGESPSAKSNKPLHSYRDMDLKRITMIYAPIFNLVFRAVSCMCRLGGDNSPFAQDIDIPWETPCRLHFPPDVAGKLNVKLTSPPEDYDPEEDPYFYRFGGHRAFAAFISTHAVVKRSIDIYSLLPPGASWDEAAEKLGAAKTIPSQRKALLDWQESYNKWYMGWKSKHGEEQAARLREMEEDLEGIRRGKRTRAISFS